ncbi:MAG: hypothetical protein R2838_02600 [Caldilineaceae bacterium]
MVGFLHLMHDEIRRLHETALASVVSEADATGTPSAALARQLAALADDLEQ